MRRHIRVFLLALTACLRCASVSTAPSESEIRHILKPAPAVGSARLEIEVLILGSDTRATLLRLTEFRSDAIRADIAQAGPGLLAERSRNSRLADDATAQTHFDVSRWSAADEASVRESIESFKKLVMPITPEETVILHGAKLVVTATSGISRSEVEIYIEHPDGSAKSGEADPALHPVAKWVLDTLKRLNIAVFQEK